MIALSHEEALARLADGDPLTIWIEAVPNNGTTMIEERSRYWCIERLMKNTPFETGLVGQQKDMGIHVHCIGGGPTVGIVRVYFATKPECRLSAQQLQDSQQRGRGADLFSKPTTTHNE